MTIEDFMGPNGGLVIGDCLQVLPNMPDASVDLVFADPPFNIGYNYASYKDNLTDKEYLIWCARWLLQCSRILKPHGSIWVAIGDEYAAQLRILLDEVAYFRSWVIWHYTFGVNCANNFTRSHTHLLYFSKDAKNFTFNADAIKMPSARQAQYGDKRAKAGGRIPDSTWVLKKELEQEAFAEDKDVWSVSRVCGTFKERVNHPCQMPEKVLERIILACSNEGDLVLDPFAGSGTTLAVARRLGRKSIGIELSPQYGDVIHKRLGISVEEKSA